MPLPARPHLRSGRQCQPRPTAARPPMGPTLLRAAVINGAFGWGTALLLRPFGLRKVELRGDT